MDGCYEYISYHQINIKPMQQHEIYILTSQLNDFLVKQEESYFGVSNDLFLCKVLANNWKSAQDFLVFGV